MTAPDLLDASNRLGQAPGLRSGHVAEAVAVMSARYRPHRLALPGGDGGLDFRHHAVSDSGASLNLLRYGPEIVVEAGSFDGFYMLEFPLRGGVDIAYGERKVSSRAGRGLLLSPGPSVVSRWHADTTQVMLRMERGLVERAYRLFTGDSVLRTPVFAPEIDLATPAGRRLARLTGLLVAEGMEAERDGAPPLSTKPILDAVLRTIFENIPCRVVERAAEPAAGPVPHYVRRFRLLLDDPAMLASTVGELASHLDVSARTLTTAMRRFTGLSPHQYLRLRRMEHARMLMRHGDLPVARIAASVGYANAGRFAADFRECFGASPSRFDRSG